MGPKQSSLPLTQQQQEMTPEEIANLQESRFNQAPKISQDEYIIKKNYNSRKSKEHQEKIELKQQQQQQQQQQQPQQQQQKQQQECKVDQEEQNQQHHYPDESKEHQQPTPQVQQEITPYSEAQLEDLWLSKIFEINLPQQTFMGVQTDFNYQLLSVQSLQDDILPCLLAHPNAFSNEGIRVDWLVSVLGKLASFGNQGTTVIKVNGQSAEVQVRSLIESCCALLTTLVLYPQTFEIYCISSENPHQIYAPINQLADRLYVSMFQRNPLLGNEGALEVFLMYLDSKAQNDERTQIIELMMKRVLKDCRFSFQDQNALVQAIQLLDILVEHPNILNGLMKESWAFYHSSLMRTGKEFQQNSIFGRLLSLSSFPKDTNDWRTYFQVKNKQVPDSLLNGLRDRIRRVLDQVHALFLKIARKKNMQEKVLSFFSMVLQLNLNREKVFNLQLQATCSSPGFISNFLYLLLKMGQPILQNVATIKEKVRLIDIDLISYLKKHPLLANLYAQTDLLNPSLTPLQEAEEFSVTPHFVTSIWLLTQKALHLHKPTIQEYLKYIEEIHKLYTRGQEQQLMQLLPVKAAYDVALLDRVGVNLTIKLLAFACLVPMSLIEWEEQSQEYQVRYPYGVLPATFLEDIHEVLQVYINSNSPVLGDNQEEIQIIAEFLTLTMSHRQLVINPHLRVKGIETISMLVPHQLNPRQRDPNLHYIFSQSQIIEKNLIQGLIKVFVDAEKTGSHNQFYDKFRYRFFFCKIFNYLIQNLGKVYSSYLEQLSKTDKETFLEFANLYLNDLIFLLDECLGKMKSMKKIEEEEEQEEHQEPQQSEDQLNKEVQYKEYKRLLQTFSFYLLEYYKNIQIISESEPTAFMTEEIREKLVNNMNYTVEQLNGENSLQYKTKAMKEVNFQPKFIMGNVIELYINFSGNESFLKQIIDDERSFSIPLFEKTARKLSNHNIITQDKLERFTQVMVKLEQMQSKKKRFQQAMSTIPEEFLDPILGELIRDPVMLPSSKVVLDRITIKKHLLNDKTDPFNRFPLTEDLLIEMPELKHRIDIFIEQQMQKQNDESSK